MVTVSIAGRSYADLMSELRALGTLCRTQGDLRRAEHHYRLALNLYESSFSECHRDAIICLFGLVQLLEDTGRPEEADEFRSMFEAMNIRRRGT